MDKLKINTHFCVAYCVEYAQRCILYITKLQAEGRAVKNDEEENI